MLLYVNDEVRATDIVLNDALWHFVAVTWSNDRGIWQIYVDGVLADGGSSLRYNDIISGLSVLSSLYVAVVSVKLKSNFHLCGWCGLRYTAFAF